MRFSKKHQSLLLVVVVVVIWKQIEEEAGSRWFQRGVSVVEIEVRLLDASIGEDILHFVVVGILVRIVAGIVQQAHWRVMTVKRETEEAEGVVVMEMEWFAFQCVGCVERGGD